MEGGTCDCEDSFRLDFLARFSLNWEYDWGVFLELETLRVLDRREVDWREDLGTFLLSLRLLEMFETLLFSARMLSSIVLSVYSWL